MSIPRYRVMNWWERGVREPDAKGRRCHVRTQEANTDGTNAQDVQRALRMCDRKPCICRGDTEGRP